MNPTQLAHTLNRSRLIDFVVAQVLLRIEGRTGLIVVAGGWSVEFGWARGDLRGSIGNIGGKGHTGQNIVRWVVRSSFMDC